MKLKHIYSDFVPLLLVAFFLMLATGDRAATLVLEGKYQNKNLYVHNSFEGHGVGFCAKEIRVNGVVTMDETNSTSLEIDLRSLQLQYGDSVVIEIDHSESCMPKILNMEDLKPKPTFEVLMMTVNGTGSLKWRTKNESGPLPYVVEQYKWNKWVPVGVVDGVGTSEEHEYTFKVAMHSGENKYRVRQKGLNYLTKSSQPVTTISFMDKPSYAIPQDFSSIEFSTETAYEVYDIYGQIVRKGFGKRIGIQSLPIGDYFLCFDNVVTEFRKLR